MPDPRLFPLTALVLAVVPPACAQEWVPLDLQICNRAGKDWVLTRDESPDWEFAFSGLHGLEGEGKAELGFGDKGHFTVASGKTLRFNAREVLEGKQTGCGFSLTDPGEETHQAHCTVALAGRFKAGELEIQARPRNAQFSGYARKLAKQEGPLVIVTGHTILIMDPLPGGPSALESKAIGPAPGKRSLPALSDDDFDGGVKDTKTFYTMERLPDCSDPVKARGIQVADFPKLHDLGHLMPDELLADYFLNTLFQYNTWRALRIEPRLDFDQLLTAAEKDANERKKLGKLSIPPATYQPFLNAAKNFAEFWTYKDCVGTAIRSFQCNPQLVWLGIAYMRQKIVVEKLNRVMRTSHGAQWEAAKNLLGLHDRYATDLQTMIFNWMFNGYREFMKNYPEQKDKAGKLALGAFLADYKPGFIDEPYYAFYMKHLKALTQAVHQIDDIKF